MRWNYLSIPKLQRLHRWSLGMDKYFHPILYNGCDYISMLGLKLNHVSKRGHIWRQWRSDNSMPLQWYRNKRDGVSDHQPHDFFYSNVYSGTDEREHQSSASLAFVRGIHRSTVNSPHKRSETRVSIWWRHHVNAAMYSLEQAIETLVIWDAIALIMTSM